MSCQSQKQKYRLRSIDLWNGWHVPLKSTFVVIQARDGTRGSKSTSCDTFALHGPMNVNLRVCQVHVPHAPCRMLWHCNPRLGYWSQGREEVFSDFLRLRFQDILRLVHLQFFYGDSYDYMYGVGVNDIWCSILLCHAYSKPGEAEQSSQTKTFVSNLNLIHFFSSLNDKQLN